MAENALPAGPVLREGEQLDDLQLNGLKILQKKGSFRYGTDAVLLANFADAGQCVRTVKSGIYSRGRNGFGRDRDEKIQSGQYH